MLASDIHQPQMFQRPAAQERRVIHPAAIAQGKLLLIGLMADAQLHADHIAMIDTAGTTNLDSPQDGTLHRTAQNAVGEVISQACHWRIP